MTTFTVWKFEDPDGAAQRGVLPQVGRGRRAGHDRRPRGRELAARRRQARAAPRARQPEARRRLGCAVGHPRRRAVRDPGRRRRRSAPASAPSRRPPTGTGITKEDLERIRTEVVPGHVGALPRHRATPTWTASASASTAGTARLISTNLTEAEREHAAGDLRRCLSPPRAGTSLGLRRGRRGQRSPAPSCAPPRSPTAPDTSTRPRELCLDHPRHGRGLLDRAPARRHDRQLAHAPAPPARRRSSTRSCETLPIAGASVVPLGVLLDHPAPGRRAC